MPWSGIRATVALAAVVGVLAAGAAPAQAVIVYRCGTTAVNLCQVNSNGSGRTQLTSEGSYEDVSLDPAGTRMVLDHGSSLYAANGSAQDPVGPISNASSLAKISSDGSTGVDDEDYSDLGEGLLVCTFATSGGNISECGFQAQFPSFTPSGEIVASFLDHTTKQFVLSKYAVGATFGGEAPPTLVSEPNASVIESAVSPNGQTLAAVVAPNDETASGYIALFSMSSGQLLRRLTNGTTDEDPAWSPDGTQLVFARGDSLYTTSASGSPGSEKLLVNEGDAPTWGGSETSNPTPMPSPGVTLPAVQSLALEARTVHAKSGLTLRATLSAAGTVVVEFKLIGHHHQHKVLKPVGSVTLTGKAGANSFKIKRVHGHLLAPGNYELVVYTQAGTTKSATRTLSLTVKH